MKKLLCLILVAFSLLCFVACADTGDAPEGMTLASVEGAPFKLYVPTNWTLNTHSGISGAYLNSTELISVNAIWKENKENQTIEAFYENLLLSYAGEFEGFEKTNEDLKYTVDQKQAIKFNASFTRKETAYKLLCVVIKHADNFVIFSYKATSENYDLYLENANIMIRELKLTEKSEINRPEKTDKDTPSGMIIASNDDAEFRLYVPENWIVNSENSLAGAYYSEENRSNVTFISYTSNESMSIEDYFKKGEEANKKIFDNYVLVSHEKNKTFGDRYAEEFIYTYEFEGQKYQVMQIICIYRNMFYTFTYTSTPDKYDLLIDDVNKIISEFTFR